MRVTLDPILERRSVREYTKTPITQEELKLLEEIALSSPTAADRQLWHFSFVTDKRLLKKINNRLKELCEAKGSKLYNNPNYDVFYDAPLVVFISAPEDKFKFVPIDCGIAVQNLAIGAQIMGLNSVILGLPIDVFTQEGCEQYKSACGFPENYGFKIAIAIGHGAKTKPAHIDKGGHITYIQGE